MKKGFTLIELMAIIIVLALLSVIIVPTVNDTISNIKQKSYEAQVSLIIEGAKKWSAKNVDKLPDGDEMINVKVSDLISGDFIENVRSGTIKNPIDGTDMEGCVAIKYSPEYNQYDYAYYRNCE